MATTDRIENIMTQSCRIERSGVSWDADLQLEFGTWGLVGIQRSVKCLLAPLQVGDDMFVIGPLERNMQRLFLPLATDGRVTDIEKGDQVKIANDQDTEVIWVAQDPPTTESFRGSDNHIEVLVERKAVQ